MIDISDVAASIMASGTFQMSTRVESWLGGVLLDGNIPIDGGTESTDMTLNVPESVVLTVPRLYRGVSYVPGSALDHPLACWGQRLRVSVGVSTPAGIEWIRRQWVYVTDTKVDGDTVNVTASGLLGLILEADLISPVAAAGTFGSMVRQLVEPALTVDLTGAPTDRSMPVGTVWDAGRLDALNELLDTWPATAYIDGGTGVLFVVPVGDTSTSSLSLTDGIGGTTMMWGSEVSRDGAANAVVARGYTAAGVDVAATTFDEDMNSPTFYDGNFNTLPVPFGYFSPLLTTVAECQKAANTIMARRKAQASRTLTTEAVPYLALQARDGVTVTSDAMGIDDTFGIVDQLTMPLTPADGAMTLGVRIQ